MSTPFKESLATQQQESFESIFKKKWVDRDVLKSRGETGLFNIPVLKRAEDLKQLEDEHLAICHDIIHKIKSIELKKSPHEVVDLLDSLSNELCLFLDLMETIRNLHTQKKWIKMVNDVYVGPKELMHQLNVDPEFKNILHQLHTDKSLELTEEENKVVETLMADMEGSMDTNLPELATLNQELDMLEYTFVNYIGIAEPSKVKVPHDVIPFKEEVVSASQGWQIVCFDPNQQRRKAAYLQLNTPSNNLKDVLKKLQIARQKKADMLNVPTFNHRALQSNVLNTPEQVITFLDDFKEALKPRIDYEVDLLKKQKRILQQTNRWKKADNTDDLYEWDISYLTTSLGEASVSRSPYFTLHGALEGLKILCKELFNVDLSPESIKFGEVYDPAIRKVSVSRDGIVLGEIYLDLYNRPLKPNDGVNHTIQAGRKASSQISRIVLSTSFQNWNKVAHSHSDYLSFSYVTTLFHEFGHALHAILGTTHFQVHSGFRTSIDFGEIPSHFMEHFLTDYRFVKRWAKHEKTGEFISRMEHSKLMRNAKFFTGLKTLRSAMYARFDVELWQTPNEEATAIYKRVHQQYSPMKSEYGDIFEASSHLTNYASTLYAYLFCEAVASHIYHEHFSDFDNIDPAAGQHYVDKLLGPGGSIHSRELLFSYLNGKMPDPSHFIEFASSIDGATYLNLDESL